MLFLKGILKKAILQDLRDFKTAVEGRPVIEAPPPLLYSSMGLCKKS